MPTLLSVMPSIPVRALDASLAFYCDKLGFSIRHQFGAGGAILIRDRAALHLTTLDDETWKSRADFVSRPIKSGAESFLPGTSAHRIEVDDARALYEEFRSKSVIHARSMLKEQSWGDLDFAVSDPDGNLLTFFQRSASNPVAH